MKRRIPAKLKAPLVVFLVLYVVSFMVWPIEKADYSKCPENSFCPSHFTSQFGGGLKYLTHIGDTKQSSEDTKLIRTFNIDSEKSTYSFAPLIVTALSFFIGLGGAIITAIVMPKFRRPTDKI